MVKEDIFCTLATFVIPIPKSVVLVRAWVVWCSKTVA